MTVYVRWYGKVVEGELLDGESMGMQQVRIPLDGHHPIALFTPGHVYDSPEQVTEKSSINCQETAEISQKTSEISQNQPDIAINDVLPADDRQSIEAFKEANWDHERGHLRIDKLDEFYWLWRMYMVPFGYVEAETKPVITNTAHEPCTPVQQPQPQKPTSQKPSKKMLRSTGEQQFTDSTQLALFE